MLRDDRELPVDLRLKAHAVCSDVERLLGRYDEAEAVAHTALEALPRPLPDPLPAGTADLTFKYGLVHMVRGTFRQARPLVREVAWSAGSAGSAAGETWGGTDGEADGKAEGKSDAAMFGLRILSAFGDTCIGEVDTAVPELARCVRLVDGLPDAAVARVPEALAMVGCSEIYLERFADAFRHLHRGLRGPSGGAQQHVVVHCLLALSILHQWTGQLEQARQRALEVERLAHGIGADNAVGLAMAMRAGALMWARGRRDTAEIVALAEEGVRRTLPVRGWWAGTAVGLLAQIRLMDGDASGCVRVLLEEGGGEGLPLLQPIFRPSMLALLSTAASRCGERDLARRSADGADADAERFGLPAQRAYARRAQALVHLTDGGHDAAATLFEQAAEGFRRAGLPVQHAWTLVAGARSAGAARGPEVAAGWLEVAVAVAEGCGAVRVCEEASRVREEEPRVRSASEVREESAPPTGAPGALGLLTGREWEIARLAAMGKRSREIAEELFLSPRTVETHLARIYRKLQVSSRVALASAIGQGEIPGTTDR